MKGRATKSRFGVRIWFATVVVIQKIGRKVPVKPKPAEMLRVVHVFVTDDSVQKIANASIAKTSKLIVMMHLKAADAEKRPKTPKQKNPHALMYLAKEGRNALVMRVALPVRQRYVSALDVKIPLAREKKSQKRVKERDSQNALPVLRL